MVDPFQIIDEAESERNVSGCVRQDRYLSKGRCIPAR